MKKHISVFGLFARCSLHRVALILCAMYLLCAAALALRLPGLLAKDPAARLEIQFAKSGVILILRLAFAALTGFLCVPGSKTASGYTLARLRVSGGALFLAQAAFNMLAYLLLWAAQVCAVTGAGVLFVKLTSPAAGMQAVFLAFYRNTYLHALLPLQDVLLWFRNLCFLIVMGLAAAEFPLLMRAKRRAFTVLPMAALTVILFPQELSHPISLFVAVGLLIAMVLKVLYDFGTMEAHTL